MPGDSSYSNWALHCVKDLCPIVGIFCGGCEEQTLALSTTIEEEIQREELVSLSNRGIKGYKELKNLESSINYSVKGNICEVGLQQGWGHRRLGGVLPWL